MALIHRAGYDGVWKELARAARDYCRLRVRNEIGIGVVYADGQGNELGRCLEDE